MQRNTGRNAEETQNLVERPPTELDGNTDEAASLVEVRPTLSIASMNDAESSAELLPPVGMTSVSPASQQDLTLISVNEKGTDLLDTTPYAGKTTQVRVRSSKEHNYALTDS